MEPNQLAIPFDVRVLHENILKKIIQKIWKLTKKVIRRSVDIIFSLLVIIFLIPMTLIVKMVYMSRGDFDRVFVTEECFGKKGKVFKAIKYRSTNKDGTVNKLRFTALDNLPKAINILSGNMTIVGPQPYKVSDREKMGLYYDRIIMMKPGITGISQISYVQDWSFENRLDNDIKYYYRKNWFTDLKIILITTAITLPRRNKGKILSFLNVTIRDFGRAIFRFVNAFIKRIIDICGGITGTIMLIPLTLIVYTINLVSGDHGPLFYSQERIGKNGKHFKMYKFRSMVVGADEKLKEILKNDPELRAEFMRDRKLKNDPRITRAGKFLRKTSLDEFPQFINVIKGEMSLVGPRAVIDGEIEKFGTKKNVVLSVKPGITGYWAANGRSDTTYEERVEMETYYAKNSNVVFDFKILFKTVMVVIKHEGAV